MFYLVTLSAAETSYDQCPLFPRLGAAELIIGPEGIASVHCRRSAPHVDSKSNRLDYLFAGSSVLMGHLGVVSNAAFAVNRDSNCECHQFLCFCVEGFGCRCRSQKRAKGLRRIWRALPQQPDPAYHIVGDLRIVLAHMMLPSIDDSLRAESRISGATVQTNFSSRSKTRP